MNDFENETSGKPSERTRLLRAAADGELDRRDREALDRHLAGHPEDTHVLRFEERLRLELRRVSAEAAPTAEEVRRLRHLAALPLDAAPRRPWLRLAAAAALLSASVLAGHLIWGSRKTSFEGQTELVAFLETHSRECPIYGSAVAERFDVKHFEGALAELHSTLGRSPSLAEMAKTDLRFVAMAPCGIPGDSVSMHMVFAGAPGTSLDGSIVHLYVQASDDRLPIQSGSTYRLEPVAPSEGHVSLLAWRRDGLDYFLAAPDGEASRVALTGADAPTVVVAL